MSSTETLSSSTSGRPDTRPMERWLWPTDLERRLEAHLLIARKIRA